MNNIYLHLLRVFVSIFPIKWRFRILKRIYNYDSKIFTSGIIFKDTYNVRYNIKSNDFIDWHIFFMGSYEQEILEVLKKAVKPGMVVIEAGANTGSETFIMAKMVGASGKVFAYEPIPHLFEKLTNNHLLNADLTNTRLINKALGERSGFLDLFVMDENISNQGMGSKFAFKESTQKIKVSQDCVDGFAEQENLQQVDLIKMDVQGAEFDILRGAINTIKKCKPTLILEVDEKMDGKESGISDLYVFLKDFGYQIYSIQTEGKLVEVSVKSLPSGNWFATTQKMPI